jgi:DNA-directed RNA polymerase subunit RPC12/RpoP
MPYNHEVSPSTEVRRCRQCTQVAVVLVSDWKQKFFGVNSGSSTRDYRCQACGATFTIHPREQQFALWFMGIVLLPAIVGLVPLSMARRRSRVGPANPVVPGAPYPPIRYLDGPPERTCGNCSGTAVARKITRSRHNGVPTGIEYEYQCQQCGAEFITESLWAHVFAFFVTSLVLGGGVLVLVLVEGALPRYGWGIGLSSVGALLLAQQVNRLHNRSKNPEKPNWLL